MPTSQVPEPQTSEESDTHSIAPSETTTTFDTRSIAPSEMTITDADDSKPPVYQPPPSADATADEDVDLEHFTAAGRPMPKYKYFRSDFPGNVNTNSLPVRFKDTSFISIPIPQSDIDAALAEAPSEDTPPSYGADAGPSTSLSATEEPSRRKSFLSTLTKKKSKEPKKPAFQTVKMTRAEYLTYFAKDEKGEYKCTEPRSSGVWKQVLRARLDDSALQAVGREDKRFVNGFEWNLAGAMVGGMA